MNFLQSLLDSTNNLGTQALLVATLLAAIGTLAMTAVETASNLWRGQMRLHRMLFQAWVRADLTAAWSRMHAWVTAGDEDTPQRHQGKADKTSQAEQQFLALACGDTRYAQILFDQPIDKFAAQLQAAANVALEYPARYEALYRFLTQPIEARAGQEHTPQGQPTGLSDTELWLEFSRRPPEQHTPEAAAAAMKARARMGNLVSRRLDVFQNAARYRWDRLRQWAGSSIAAALAAGVATQVNWARHEALLLPFLLLAGAMAPFANDVVNRLGSFRGKG